MFDPVTPEMAGEVHPSQERFRSALISAYRKPRKTPRPGVNPKSAHAFEDPAPDWLWQLVDVIFARTVHEPDHGLPLVTRAIAWCEDGDPDLRSAQLRTLIAAWVGPRAPMIALFLEAAEKTKGGPRKKQKPRLRGRVVQFSGTSKPGEGTALVVLDGTDEPQPFPIEHVHHLLGPRRLRLGDRCQIDGRTTAGAEG